MKTSELNVEFHKIKSLVSAFRNYITKDLGQLIRAGSFVLSANVIERLSSIIIFIMLARVYGAEQYGRIITVFTVCSLADIVYQFGFPTFIQRETARGNSLIEMFILKTLFLRCLFYIPFVLTVAVYFRIVQTQVIYSEIGIISFAVFLISICQIPNAYYFGKNRNSVVLFSIIYSRLLMVFASLPIIYLGKPTNWIFFVFAISYCIQFYVLVRGFTWERFKLRRKNYSESLNLNTILFKECWPLVFSAILVFGYDRIDTVLISIIKGYHDVAYYNIAYNAYKFPIIGLSLIFVPAYSKFSQLSNSAEMILASSKKMGLALLACTIVLSGIIYYFAGEIISIIYGGAYTRSAGILRLLSVSFIFLVLNNFTNLLVNSLKLNRANLKIFISGLIINIGLNLILIRVYGIMGAATATVMTELAIFVMQFYLIKGYFRRAVNWRN